jgi:DNA invertase Pin-like site-specific DNA recombinase
MIAAIYARKSTEENGVADEDKSVTRQIEHARAYAARKGWLVADDHIFVDDGISGAEFLKRPALARLMNSLRPSPPFQMLIMSEEARFGREQIQSAYLLKQVIDAGVRVFLYLEDRERTLESALDKVMLSLTSFAAEVEREKAGQRTHDALRRKAKALHVTGGKVYGYDNVEVLGEVPDAEGRRVRVHVTRRINPEHAAVIVRMFELYAHGLGLTRIAKRLNAEHVPAPRGQGWAGSGIREMLHRELYRGVVVWNRSQRIVRGGTKTQRKRPKDEWVIESAPQFRIVSDELWRAVHERLARATPWFTNMRQGGTLPGRPSHTDSAYLLTGFATCGTCRGAVATITRMHGTAPHRHPVRFYGCPIHDKRGNTICSNRVVVRHEIVERAILSAISEVLDEQLLTRALDKALDRLKAEGDQAQRRQPQIERDLNQIEGRISRLLDVLADGKAPKDEVVGRLNAEKARKTDMIAELERARLTDRRSPNLPRLKEVLQSRLRDVQALLGRHTPHARQLLRKLLAGKIEMTPLHDQQRGYHFRGALALDRLIEGEARQLVPSWWPQRDSNPVPFDRSKSAVSLGAPFEPCTIRSLEVGGLTGSAIRTPCAQAPNTEPRPSGPDRGGMSSGELRAKRQYRVRRDTTAPPAERRRRDD